MKARVALPLICALIASPLAAAPSPQARANNLIYQQWAKSAGRAQCAPLGVTPAIADGGTPRAADFSDGWGVAFDRPGQRSSFGVAGTGIRDAGGLSHAARTDKLALQWPLTKQLRFGRQLAVAGYGIEGGRPYSAENPDGAGEDSIAYVYVDGQTCLYNVWSKRGRAHLETLLGNLFVLPMRKARR